MKSKLIIILVFLVVVLGFKVATSFSYDHFCKNNVDEELQSKVTENVMSANIRVVKKTEGERKGNIVMMSYNPGASGVIFKKAGNKYYALTASHVISFDAADSYFVIPYGRESYTEALEHNKNLEMYDYYEALPAVKVEHVNEEYDLAIISFQCEDKLSVLNIAPTPLKFDDKVISIENDFDNDSFRVTYGKVTTKEPVEFEDVNGQMKHKIIEHSSYVEPGSSGGALLNENLQIAGINLGGSVDVFGNFRYGMALPSDKVQQFLKEWK